MLARYFQSETARLSEHCLSDIKTLDDWKLRRGEYRNQLFDMLGLAPLPEKTDLKPVITGKVEHEQFTVEKLHFQSMPHLYVTANFYIPKNIKGSCPTILYVCGHAKMVTNGVSLGNKTAYQHHGAWFARNGYACLIVDTLQLGEIEGIHHGTYRENMWWWNSRGYSPAGVEAWNNIRALDYLETRPEVDKTRIGMTGRSGGGAYTWVAAALDDRIKVTAPIAGITDLQNYVVDGTVEGHCDCMFPVNTYRWDYPLLAALTAPRALMLGNSDKDKIFPLDGIERLHAKVRGIYNFYGAADKLALLITDGPHADTQDLQLPVFRWFNRQLKNVDPIIEMAATNCFAPEQLRVFEKLPEDQIDTTIHERFVPAAAIPPVPSTLEAWNKKREEWMKGLREKTFAGWPESSPEVSPKKIFEVEREGLRFSAYDFTSQADVVLRLYSLRSAKNRSTEPATLKVLDEQQWKNWIAAMQSGFGTELAEEIVLSGASANEAAFRTATAELEKMKSGIYIFSPRGIGLSAWSSNEKKQIHIRRRFMLLGQTLEGMRVWDIRRALQVVRKIESGQRVNVMAEKAMGVNALYASFFEPALSRLELTQLPLSHKSGPDYLNVLQVLDLPEAVALGAEKYEVVLKSVVAKDWAFATDTVRTLQFAGGLNLVP